MFENSISLDHNPKDTKTKTETNESLTYKPERQILTSVVVGFNAMEQTKMENFPIFCKQTF